MPETGVASPESSRRTAFDAVIFDMDGVLTRTATLHAQAWKALFDDFLCRRAEREGEPFRAFDAGRDYRAYVDGKPREEGVRSFLRSRGIELPEGKPDDARDAETIHALAARKDALFRRLLEERGVEVFESTVAFIEALRGAGARLGIVTSSRNGRDILARTGTDVLFDARVDGIDAAERGLRGKPDPDAFLACAADLGVTPGRSVVVEDAAAGIAAARRGGFGLAVGVDRGGNRLPLEHHGAHVVVGDLGELDVATLERLFIAAWKRRSWRIEQEGFDPAREHGVESLFTVGNGYLGVRGALDTPLALSRGDLLIAGVYDRKQAPYPATGIAGGEDRDAESDFVAFPFPFRIRISVLGTPLSLEQPAWKTHRRILDMREGLLHAETTYECEPGMIVTMRSRRCALLDDPHVLLQEVSLQLENFSAPVEIDASIAEDDLAVRHPHLVPVPPRTRDPALEVQCFRTRASGIDACIAQRTALAGTEADGTEWQVSAAIGETLRFRRYVAVYTSRDVDDPEAAAVEALRARTWEQFDATLEAHGQRWQATWERADVTVLGNPADEQALRFLAYHLSIAADRDPRVSVGARTLSGPGYQGHVFWDVEVFMLPFYLHTAPDVARCLLSYRHHTLDGARRRAAELGYRGACYAWESTVTGADVTPRVAAITGSGEEIPLHTGTQQIHVTAGVAYAVWRYWEATGDDEFLRGPGAEILAETARFWTSRAVPDGGAWHIRDVMGPDEYHHDVNDNAYTNWMARFNLERAVQVSEWLRAEDPASWDALAARIGLEAGEPEEWRDVARRMYVPAPRADGVIEQFEGFFDLEDYPLEEEARLEQPLDRLFDLEKINGVKLIKQADVLMLPFLFPQSFDRRIVAANYAYYEPMTDHRSSLSPGVHAALAARLGLEADAQRFWEESLMLDLSDAMGNSALGVHPACMGGTWQALVFHILGLQFVDGRAVVDPEAPGRLPEGWRAVALNLLWRGRSHRVEVTK